MNNYDIYIKELKNQVSSKRFQHSLNVAKAAQELAKTYDQDEEKAYIAGLLHDIAKEMSHEKHLEILKKAGFSSEDFAQVSCKVFHGFAGSEYVKDKFKITDEGILGAIRYHTTGKKDMTLAEKIIFVADYISQDREWSDVEFLRDIAHKDIDAVVLCKLSMAIKKCVNHKQTINPDTVEAYNQIIYEKS